MHRPLGANSAAVTVHGPGTLPFAFPAEAAAPGCRPRWGLWARTPPEWYSLPTNGSVEPGERGRVAVAGGLGRVNVSASSF